MADIVVLGSLNMDLVVRTARMPRPGETVSGHSFVTVPGGKGANQAAAAARLGATVEMVGRVGNDAFGPALLQNLANQGVGTSYVTLDEEVASGTAIIMVDDGGENSIVVAAGANGRVGLPDLEAARSAIRGSRYLMLQYEVPLDVVWAAVEMARELGVQVILNAAPAHPTSSDRLDGVHCVMVNEHEAEFFTGIPVPDLASAERAGVGLLKMGVEAAIITLGPRGAYLVTDDLSMHVPAHVVDVVDTTAAGDAFAGGLTVALLRGYSMVEAVRYASCAGTLATTVLGAQTSLPSEEQVQAFYEG